MFRFEKHDFGLLNDALLRPEVVCSILGVVVSGEEALLMCLRRLAYPNRWWDLEPIFGRHSSAMPSIVGQVLRHIDGTFGHLLDDLTTHSWLSFGDLKRFARCYEVRLFYHLFPLIPVLCLQLWECLLPVSCLWLWITR
ncbi:hypothetical protein HPB47_001691 [Ixodes persulcatus]|uniref:Uncharacterized protein n=1 Tax=Ixodes persulcatus TaxID=34615 RepID=A0AC60PNF9_IXOPE|nr:hypothetical protein HPB47_001691 [Ixodes persulcatus]